MERGGRLVLAAAGVTALVLVAQVALINAMSGAYLERGGDLQRAEEEAALATGEGEGRARVFAALPTLPVVLMHGMGDAAGNAGMRRIQKVRALLLVGVDTE
jgi:hypothetical protein